MQEAGKSPAALAQSPERVNAMQARFVELVLGGMSPDEAKGVAGYAETTRTANLLAGRAVSKALREGRKSIITGELGMMAVSTLRELMQKGNPAATRFSAARLVLSMDEEAGKADETKPLGEMSTAELMAMVAKMEDRLKSVEGDIPNVTPQNGA